MFSLRRANLYSPPSIAMVGMATGKPTGLGLTEDVPNEWDMGAAY